MNEENVCQVFRSFSINHLLIIYFSKRKSLTDKRNYEYWQKIYLYPKDYQNNFLKKWKLEMYDRYLEVFQ